MFWSRVSVRRTVIAAFALAALLGAGPALADNPVVALETTKGEIRVELYPERAPETVENFLTYVRNGHYDGTVFHRVIPGFMIQGGGFTADYQRKDTRAPIRNEADNGLNNDRGTIAMARTADPHSATAQFFINVADNDFLDHRGKSRRGWGYAVFGEVISGLGTVDEIVSVETGAVGPFSQNAPLDPIVIERARVE
jgi:cyclophilin family peptidyl-prolyl cis-trans isomerase